MIVLVKQNNATVIDLGGLFGILKIKENPQLRGFSILEMVVISSPFAPIVARYLIS